MKMRGVLSLFLILLCLGFTVICDAQSPMLSITNCTMIDGTGKEPLPQALILVKDGILEYAGPSEGAKIPDGYQELNLNGATVLPGFINAHVHNALEKENLRRWLRAGVTSVRDLDFSNSKDVPERLKLKAGCDADPSCARVFASTPCIAPKDGYGVLQYSSIEELKSILDNTLSAGFDLVKTSVEDDCMGKKWEIISAEALELICREAHAKGLRVAAHLSWAKHIDLAVQAGVDSIEHMVLSPLDRATAEKVSRKGIYWIPTLELHKRLGESRNSNWHLDRSIPNLKLYAEVGGLIAFGTDFGGYKASFDPGFPITEVKLLRKAGLTPMQIIVSATKNAAVVCGKGDQLGTIEKGKWADIVAVNGDPLKDIEVLEKIHFVMKSGQIVPLQ
jgi:imidazolonepropionase-like amidohydrolase